MYFIIYCLWTKCWPLWASKVCGCFRHWGSGLDGALDWGIHVLNPTPATSPWTRLHSIYCILLKVDTAGVLVLPRWWKGVNTCWKNLFPCLIETDTFELSGSSCLPGIKPTNGRMNWINTRLLITTFSHYLNYFCVLWLFPKISLLFFRNKIVLWCWCCIHIHPPLIDFVRVHV